MGKEIEELQKTLEEIVSFDLPKYKELPTVELYMEQVLKYINGVLSSVSREGEKQLTSFMVNNYVKAKMIDEPVKKKYSQEQIGYLIAICMMKPTVSMADLALLLELTQGVSSDKKRLYEFWSMMERNILSLNAEKIEKKINEIVDRYERETTEKPEDAEENLTMSLGFYALRLAIQAQANKLLSDHILDAVRKRLHPDDYSLETDALLDPTTRAEEAIGDRQAAVLGAAKGKRKKLAQAAAKKAAAQQAKKPANPKKKPAKQPAKKPNKPVTKKQEEKK